MAIALIMVVIAAATVAAFTRIAAPPPLALAIRVGQLSLHVTDPVATSMRSIPHAASKARLYALGDDVKLI